jgi:hypothetical protein
MKIKLSIKMKMKIIVIEGVNNLLTPLTLDQSAHLTNSNFLSQINLKIN